MQQTDTFRQVLRAAEQLARQRKAGIVFMGETPRFPNENLGWIGLGDQAGSVDGLPYYHFRSWIYRPGLEECRAMFAAGNSVWNTGYFVTTLGFIERMYATHQPQMWAAIQEIGAAIGRPEYADVLRSTYAGLESIHFDDAIARHVDPADALVLHEEMGWSDPGTLYALKEAINPDPQTNVTMGRVLAQQAKDCLLYNYDDGKLLAVVGLEGMIVVNTGDAILVVHKDKIPLVKQLVDGLEGTELEKYS
jgi:mannose-1-phosphate guanylyltransferase